MKIPSRLLAKTKGKQLAGSLYLSPYYGHFLVKDETVELTNEAANALFNRLCMQGLQFNNTVLTNDELHYIVQAFEKYQCEFIDNVWIGIKPIDLHMQNK